MLRRKRSNKIKLTFGEALYSVFNYTIVTLVALTMVYPLINMLAISLSDYNAYLDHPWMIWPIKFTAQAYRTLIGNRIFWRSYLNTIVIAVCGITLALAVTSLAAYALARKELKGKNIFLAFMIFTMMFGAGMVPAYLNLKELGMLNKLVVLFVPSCFSTYNCVLMTNFFRGIAYDMIEAAMIDGASEPRIFTKIVLPLSKPVMASIGLFLAVSFWNNYFGAQIYLKDRDMWPVSLVLKEMLYQQSTLLLETDGDLSVLGPDADHILDPLTFQYASVIVATVPILCVYPFLQKYFAKGVMLGGLKG